MTEMIEQRRQVRCCVCADDFSFIIRVTRAQLAQPELFVTMECPFCKSKLRVDLSPWRRRLVESYRAIDDEPALEGELTLELPDELPTQLADTDASES